MIRTPYTHPIRKRPRQKPHKFEAIVSKMNDVCDDCGHICQACMEAYAAEAEYNRPGHVWAVAEGKVIYLEDKVIESRLGRPLKATEGVLHRNGDVHDNCFENLEVVNIDNLETE
jgi:hypothetical protein